MKEDPKIVKFKLQTNNFEKKLNMTKNLGKK